MKWRARALPKVAMRFSSSPVLSVVITSIYKTVWSPSTGEILEAAREPDNPHDHQVVCLRKTEVIVGHVPRRFGRVFLFFLSHGGRIRVNV